MSAHPDYRSWLKEEYSTRVHKNSRYSIRAFAKFLQMDPRHLNSVLLGKKGLSSDNAKRIASTLGWSQSQVQTFEYLVQSEHARSHQERKEAAAKVKETLKPSLEEKNPTKNLSVELFQIIRAPHHFAIVELLKIPGHSTAEKIAQKLDLPIAEIRNALERLEKLELVEFKNKKWIPCQKMVFSPDGIPAEAIRQSQEILLQNAKEAIYSQNADERDLLSLILPFDPKEYKRAKAMIRSFTAKFRKEFSRAYTQSEIYSLQLQFYRLSTLNTPHKKGK